MTPTIKNLPIRDRRDFNGDMTPEEITAWLDAKDLKRTRRMIVLTCFASLVIGLVYAACR